MEKKLSNFLDHLKIKNYNPSSINKRFKDINRFFGWCYFRKIKTVQEISQNHLMDYIAYLQEQGRKKNTVDTYLRSIKAFYAYLEMNQIILLNPFDNIDLPGRDNRLMKNILSEEEIKKLLNAPNVILKDGLRNRALMEVLYSTAIRRCECMALTVFDVDLEGGYIRVNQGKGRKDRIIPLGKIACEYLKQYLTKVRPFWLKDPDCKSLFISRKGKALDMQTINWIVRSYGRKLKLEKRVTTHGFRKAAITHMLRHGASPLYLQRMLGHTSNRSMRPYIIVSAFDVKTMHQSKHPREKNRHSGLDPESRIK